MKEKIIRSKNPHWCLNYLRKESMDTDVGEMVDIILNSESFLALFELNKMRKGDPRFKYLSRGEFLKKMKKLGAREKSLRGV